MGTKEILQSKTGLKVEKTSSLFNTNHDINDPHKEETIEMVRPLLHITRGTKEAAVKAGLIPNIYIDCDFDIEKIKRNQTLQAQSTARKFKVINFDKYSELTEGIIATIISRRLPKRSYIIGAPNGFGKTSFANSCILKLFAQNRMCAPYISLTELAQVKIANEQRLLTGLSSKSFYERDKNVYYGEDYLNILYSNMNDTEYIKSPIHLVSRFSWSEYTSCDVLFCYFTDVGSRIIESEILKTVLNIRGTKGLPTIAMISTSLSPYKNDPKLAEMVWNEILDPNDTMEGYDRLKHVSCYKDYNAPLRRM